MKRELDLLFEICKNTKDPLFPYVQRRHVVFGEHVSFSIADENLRKFDELVLIILRKNNNIDIFSEKYVRKSLEQLIARVLKADDYENLAEVEYRNLLKILNDFNTEYRVIVPIVGIALEKDKLPCGTVNLLKGTDKLFDDIANDIKTVIYQTTHTDKEKILYNDMVKNNLLNIIKGFTLSEINIIAEPIRAQERALEETIRVIDILRFGIPTLYEKESRVNIAILGDLFSSVRIIPIISKDKKHFTLQSDKIGPLQSYIIDSNTLKKLNNIGIDTLFNLLKKGYKQISPFEKSLLYSIHWFSTSLIQIDNENRLLNLIVSIETLLTPKDGSPISSTIAESVAIILGKDLEERKYIKKQVLKIYKKRSSVSHGGEK